MSWSVTAVGKSAAVGVELERQFSTSVCAEPEESVRQAARAAITAALAGQSDGTAVLVSASGSMSASYTDGKPGPPMTNYLKIEVQPLYNFAE